MKEFTYVITDPEGIHARPAGEFVKAAAKFESDVTITKGEKTVSAKKIFGVMGLAVKQGQEITIKTEGSDEETAAAELEAFLKNNL
ncbi:MAG: HPr family phosphocarrier protein [Lachnospiraceae bacterium]|nr:HPr family phosphocarrier protein [Lachnospiraceae bacterium]